MGTIYNNAIISVRMGHMLSSDHIHRMIVAQTASDAAKVLFECG